MRISKSYLAGAFLAALLPGEAPTRAQQTAPNANVDKQTVPEASKFICNGKALNPAERARHKLLTEKLLAVRIQIVEMPKGYELRFRPADVSLADLTDWVVAESKCCPFFDFHIDLENSGTLLCLRLTGEPGIKAFIRSEFQVAPQ